MDSRRFLVGVSAAQLTANVTGLAVALSRGHAYDLPGARGSSATIRRDAIWIGTALSAPGPMLVAQAALTAALRRRRSRGAAQALGVLGALMIGGYLAERLVRQRLGRGGWDAVETPLVVVGLGSAGAMAVTGLLAPRRRWVPGARR